MLLLDYILLDTVLWKKISIIFHQCNGINYSIIYQILTDLFEFNIILFIKISYLEVNDYWPLK